MKLLCLLFLCANITSHAQRIRFNSIQSAVRNESYRVVCSNLNAIQAHVTLTVENQKVKFAQVIAIQPLESIYALTNDKTLKNLDVIAEPKELIFRNYYFELIIEEKSPDQFVGQLYYDSLDGYRLDRIMNCGLTNYLLAPAQ